ncbi:hypothetical protein HDU99_006772 [Rhizoclosmatium hyalinum]|nr:hypothetical protein HDU99_006772 [Rhizoclosmatium hyalinum]
MNPNPAPLPIIYETNLVFRICDFSSQTSGQLLTPVTILSNSVQDFTSKLFIGVRPHLKKKADMNSSTTPPTFSWDPCGENIDERMLGDYIQFHDTIGKRKFYLSSVTTDMLVNWRERFPIASPLPVIVSVNSNAIATSPIHKQFIKALCSRAATDRSGADTEQSLNEMITRLRQHYQGVYVSQHVNWRIWASILLQGDVQTLEERFLRGPDASIIHLFATAGVNHEVGIRLNTMSHILNQIGAMFQDLDTRLAAAEEENVTQQRVLMDMQQALRPVEPQVARGIFNQITNMMDLDHGGIPEAGPSAAGN